MEFSAEASAELSAELSAEASAEYSAEELFTPLSFGEGLGESLFLFCEQPKLYMQYDLTLSQLAETIGTSREALGAWFAEHDDTYNAYINRLRIDHFVRLYREAAKSGRSSSVFELAHECGYRSYLSFYTAFWQRMDTSVMAWVRNEENKK